MEPVEEEVCACATTQEQARQIRAAVVFIGEASYGWLAPRWGGGLGTPHRICRKQRRRRGKEILCGCDPLTVTAHPNGSVLRCIHHWP